MGKKKLLGWAAGAALVAAGAGLFFREPPAPPAPPSPIASAATSAPAASPASGLTLPAREGLARPRGNLFGSNAPPPRPAPPPPKPVAEAPPPKPVAPPMPYRVAGQVVHDGPAQVVLTRDDRLYLVREGDTLDGGYRVESVRPDAVTLVYLPLQERQQLAVVGSLEAPSAAAAPAATARAADAAAPAQLRWEGPSTVQAGSEFDVALKITSKQPVRGSPMQLSYDAKLLEPVSVRAGGFFVDGSFTYRVNPAGSIFVGAFGKGEVPADAEFLVVTFKPIRAGATAELKLSSMVLQGPGGAAVGHAPLAAFRTSITQ